MPATSSVIGFTAHHRRAVVILRRVAWHGLTNRMAGVARLILAVSVAQGVPTGLAGCTGSGEQARQAESKARQAELKAEQAEVAATRARIAAQQAQIAADRAQKAVEDATREINRVAEHLDRMNQTEGPDD
jgi:uncharacterized protein HemX